MKKPILLGLFSATLLVLTLFSTPLCFAGPHGGFGGGGFHGGGFHGGGTGWSGAYHGGGWGGYHGGGYYGSYHGGGYYGGYHGGYWHGGYGWHGGYWGYPGWGFGVSFSFGWGGYWPEYPYYVYTPAPLWVPYCSPYYPCYGYPYYAPVSAAPAPATTAYDQTSSVDASPPDTVSQPYASPAQPQVNRFSAPQGGMTLVNASYRPASNQNASSRDTTPRLAKAQVEELRPEVSNVIRALRAMPPAARERQIASGRYGNLSTQELEFVKYAAGIPTRP